ncbi:hypothetical protein DID76_02945 [Candidatus Marinamargulisbacteria bacterium SCGC AG-414-C22]|nr:hypothetical protein DID76_02945 [Candidatus Marinamargulisbacteria bacterium SCGC AG-414-C22]
MKLKKIYLVLFIIHFITTQPLSITTRDPQQEPHIKVYIGHTFNTMVIGIANHLSLSDSTYIDQEISLLLKKSSIKSLTKNISFSTTIQVNTIGYQRYWLTNTYETYSNKLFIETLE